MIHSALFAVHVVNVGRPDVAGERMESKHAKLGWVSVGASDLGVSADLPVRSDILRYIRLTTV